jgi:hypothetical protein
MEANPVFIFGAGASKACGGPLTDQILHTAFSNQDLYPRIHRDRPKEVDLVQRCLIEHFHVPRDGADEPDYPPLTLFMSLLDLAIERNRPLPQRKPEFPKGIGRQELTSIRATVEYIIFAVLDYHLRTPAGSAYRKLLRCSLIDSKAGPRAISLNYDIILDNLMCELAQANDPNSAPDYGCDIRTPAYTSKRHYGKLLKLHGSLNWMFCPGCQRLDLGMSASGKEIADSSLLEELYNFKPLDRHYLCSDDSCEECQCKFCGTPLRAVMITPSFVKDYRNPHIQRVWYEAEGMLRESTQVYIVGYSLPNDDLEVIHLLRRGLEHLSPESITVISNDPDQATVRRYQSLFGQIRIETEGFEGWVNKMAPQVSSEISSVQSDRRASYAG